MGRVEVREAIATCLAEAGLPHVGRVFPARPQIIQEEDYEVREYVEQRFVEVAPTDAGTSAVLVVHLVEDTRRRRALTGRGAVNDTRIHKAALEVLAANTAGVAVDGQTDYDGVVDAIVELIRANPTLSAPETVWSSGEYDNGVQHQQAASFVGADGLTVFVHGVLRWDVYEWIAGNVA